MSELQLLDSDIAHPVRVLAREVKLSSLWYSCWLCLAESGRFDGLGLGPGFACGGRGVSTVVGKVCWGASKRFGVVGVRGETLGYWGFGAFRKGGHVSAYMMGSFLGSRWGEKSRVFDVKYGVVRLFSNTY